MSGTSGQEEKISGAKIEPLESEAKTSTPHSGESSAGAAPTEAKIDRTRIEPLGGAGVGQNPSPVPDEQGVVGQDSTIQESKIEPLKGPLSAQVGSQGSDGTYKGDVGDTTGARTTSTQQGLEDQAVEGARIQPMGSVREDIKP